MLSSCWDSMNTANIFKIRSNVRLFFDSQPPLHKAVSDVVASSVFHSRHLLSSSLIVGRICFDGIVLPKATRISKHLRRYLYREVENFRNLANSMPLIVWTADANGAVDFFNRPYFEYTGIDPYNMTDTCWEKAVVAEDLEALRQGWMAAVEHREPYILEHRIRRAKDGMERWHLVRAVPLLDEKGHVVKWYGTATDIHDYRILTEKLKKTQKAAVLASASKSTFLANMSHEIRTPLGAILGFVELLQQPDLSREDMQRFISVISRNSKQLLRLVDDILDLTKVEAGKVIIEQLDFSLVQLLSDICCLMEIKAHNKGIDFEIELQTALPASVRSDPYRIRQILSNALSNAMKFTDQGCVRLVVAAYSDHLEIRVSDTGCGITEAQAKLLFQPFSQATTSTARKYGGTGLGLVLTKRLAEALGGDYWLERSEPGKGSTFCARLPLGISENCLWLEKKDIIRNCESTAPKISDTKALAGKRVLLVEDMPDNQKLISLYLQKLGCEITLAENGKVGFEKAQDGAFDLILMDIQMPLMNGYEATRRLRENNFRQPIIALTAHAMAEERKKALESGFDGFLTKPVQRQQLIDVLESHIH